MSRSLPPLPGGEHHDAGQVLRHCPRILFEARQMIDGGDLPPAKLFMVEQGVALIAAARPGWRKPVILSLAGPGTVLPPLAPAERLGGLTKTIVIAIPTPACDKMLAHPDTAAILVDGLLEALHERQESFANASGGRHEERLRSTLYQLARRYGKVCRGGVEIPLPLTHELLAQMIGCARETITCTLARFRQEGLLKQDRHAYHLTIPPSALEPSGPHDTDTRTQDK
jgi:hypothetical protein